MMDESYDWTYAKLFKPKEARLSPAPIRIFNGAGRDAFPQHGITHGAKPKLCEKLKVFFAPRVPLSL
jgi:hypothetical protein